MSDKDQKTHDPTPKRIDDARQKGDVPTSSEIKHIAVFAGMLVVLGGMGVHAFARMGGMLVRLWGRADDYRFGDDGAQQLVTGIVQELATIFAPLFGTLILCALLGGAMQGPFLISWSRVTPKWSKLSPAAGMKRMFSVRALIELGKTLAKFGIVAGVATWVLWPHAAALDTLIGADPTDVGAAAAHLIVLHDHQRRRHVRHHPSPVIPIVDSGSVSVTTAPPPARLAASARPPSFLTTFTARNRPTPCPDPLVEI